MKKLFTALICVLPCIGMSSCSNEASENKPYSYYDMEIVSHNVQPFSKYSPDNIDLISEHSALIVKGTVADDGKEPEYIECNVVGFRIATVSTLTVTEVIKGDVQEGDTLDKTKLRW